jgi:ATP:corrinoid adenosyltransferase
VVDTDDELDSVLVESDVVETLEDSVLVDCVVLDESVVVVELDTLEVAEVVVSRAQ